MKSNLFETVKEALKRVKAKTCICRFFDVVRLLREAN